MCFKYILTLFLLLFIVYPSSAWVSGYDHRMPIEINNTGNNLTDFQYNFTMDTAAEILAGNMTSDNGSDCCIADSSDVLQSFWNETAFNLSDTKIWVNATSLGNITNTTHYIYYGQSGASSLIDGHATFPFYDGFESKGVWVKYSDNPVMSPYTTGARFDDGYLYIPNIIKNGTNDYIMYYCGGHSPNGFQRDNIGLATSTDLHNWTRYNGSQAEDSIIYSGSSGDFDYNRAWGANSVIKENASSWKMWYTGDSTHHDTHPDHTCRIGYATSSDGYNWTKYVGSEFGGSIFEDFDGNASYPGGAENPVVLKESDTDYKMWYHIYVYENVKYATSTDGINWTIQNGGNPVMNGWSPSSIMKIENTYYMWAHQAYADITIFTSTDCINWTNHGVQLTVDAGAWDQDACCLGYVFEDIPGQWHMGYMGSNGTITIGFASLNMTIPIESEITWTTTDATGISTEQAKSGTHSMKLNDSNPAGYGLLSTTFGFQDGIIEYDFNRVPDGHSIMSLYDAVTSIYTHVVWQTTNSIQYHSGAGWADYSNGAATATSNVWESQTFKFKESTGFMGVTVNNTYLGTGGKRTSGTIDQLEFQSGDGPNVGVYGYIDNIRVRKYAVTEPIASLGAEESASIETIIVVIL